MLEGLDVLKAEVKAQGQQLAVLERKVDDSRYQMAQRETELLLVLREACRCELWAPENYFDGDRLVRQGRLEQLTNPEEFQIPLSTYWWALDMDDI